MDILKSGGPNSSKEGVSDVELQRMTPVGARIQRHPDGWQATILREDQKGNRHKETFPLRKGSIERPGDTNLPPQDEALARGKQLALEDIRRVLPGFRVAQIEIIEPKKEFKE